MSERSTKAGIRWRRWIGGGFLLLILGLFLGHLIWGSLAERRVESRVAALRKAGEPIMPSDFDVEIPEGENAGTEIRAAAAMIDSESQALQAFDKLNVELPLRPDEKQNIEAVIQDSAKALETLEKATAKSRLEFDQKFTSPVLDSMLPSFNNLRELANVLGAAALLDHEQGNDRSAVQRLERSILISRYAGKHPSIVGHLVAIGIGALVGNRASDMASDLRIGGGANDASPAGMRRLIDELLNDEPFAAGLVRSMRGERMLQLDVMQTNMGAVGMVTGINPGRAALHPVARYAMRPIMHRNSSIMLDYMTQMIKATGEKDLTAMRANLPTLPPKSILNTFASILLPSLERVIEGHFRGMTDRHLAATALAIRWYAVEHDGKLPDSLEQLVPRYLPVMPVDPFSRDGKPLSYIPNQGAPIVYSVGTDGSDDGGSEQSSNPRRRLASEWEMRDRVLPLTRRPRPLPEVVDEPEVEGVPALKPSQIPEIPLTPQPRPPAGN